MANSYINDVLRRYRTRMLTGWLLGGLIGGCFTPLMTSAMISAIISAAICDDVFADNNFVAGSPVAENSGNGCVLLKNDNVLLGNAYQIGEYVIIRRGDDSELRLPRTSVACWAASTRELYRYRVDHRQSDGFDIHIREAEWCLQNDLVDLAKEELQLANKMMPDSQAVARIEERIRRITSPLPTSVPLVENIMPVPPRESPSAASGIHPLAISVFARNVQVTLTNRCGNCHAADAGRAWTIASPRGHTRASSEMTSNNILATLPFVNSDQPLDSELLAKAVTAHGGAGAPLGQRHAKAVYSLKRWLLLVSQSMPAQSEFGPNVENEPSSVTKLATEDSAIPYLAAKEPEPRDAPAKKIESDATVPRRLPVVEDPFDPDLFNRQFHR